MNTVQGNNVVLSLMKDDWVQLLCASDMNLSLNLDTLENKTIGDGHWASFAHEKLSYTINISGLAIVNDTDDQTNFSAFDSANHWVKSLYVHFRISFYDDIGDIKSFQGYALVTGLSFDISTGALVKDNCTLTGTGELLFFDGLIPCDSLILTITVTGQTAADGIIHIAYTYSGAPYQVKYQIDGTGSWIYSLVGIAIDIPGLSLGDHSIEMVPVCPNGYEADNSTSQAFQVTQALTCSAVIDDITITTMTATPHISSGTPPGYFFSIDGGTPGFNPIGTSVSIGGLTPGSHSITMTPECSNGLTGTGFTKSFTVTSNPTQSIIDWQLASFTTGNTLNIYVNGILTMGTSTPGTGSITVPNGATIRGELIANNLSGSHATLRTQDVTLSTILDTRNGIAPTTLAYIFTTNGDEFSILGTVTP
jgi:hypothetical protein